VLIPVGIFLIVARLRQHLPMHHMALFGLGHLQGFCLFLVYNTLQNGHPLATGYHVADSWMETWFVLSVPMLTYNLEYLVKLLTWSFPCLPLLALAAVFSSTPARVQRWERCLAAMVLALMLTYALIAFPEGPGYGPRYYYSGFLAIPLLGARGLVWLDERCKGRLLMPFLLGAGLLTAGIVLPYHSTLVYREIYARNDFERQVQRLNPGPALVFLPPDRESGQAPTRNTVDFQGATIYALDLGEHNSRLMQAYPGRRYFRYQYDRDTGQSTLQEITQVDRTE
jgi:hypothetical protein